ncbi:hypothetical protein [Staphylococcus sp. HMSC10C03]|uniref:Uncharacterized protein n=1 Tax=Staphylococcus simulans TaxID=1286 RepID=A0A6N2YMN5_STASI|nr:MULTISPECIES: hypothetical protein [Staphylococcus]MBO0386227.1 hypothetical protein [Staphylococcus simulans]OFU77302.1 hypothetical protein HMPREF3110_09020 [Staphylococcus sp. HMSC10C03]
MKFNDWLIKVKYDGEHEILTNENTLVIIDQDDDVALYVRDKDGVLKVNKINYNSDFYIDADNKVLELEIHNPAYDEL